MWYLALDGERASGAPTRPAGGDTTLRPNRDLLARAHRVADADAARGDDLAPDPERDVALPAQLRERREHRVVRAPVVGVARRHDAARHRLDPPQQRVAGVDLAAAPAVLLPRLAPLARD